MNQRISLVFLIFLIASCYETHGPSLIGSNYSVVNRVSANLSLTSVTPTQLGTLIIGQSTTASLNVVNSGPDSATLGTISTSALGLGAGFLFTGGTCTSGLILLNQQSCTLLIQFTPGSVANTSTPVTVTYRDAASTRTMTLSLAGSGRILSYTNGQPASVVIGQNLFTTKVSATTATSLSYPWGDPSVHNGVVYINDYYNSRILGYSPIPTSNGPTANFVIGQTNFTSSTYGAGLSRLNYPWTTTIGDNQLGVADTSNNRVIFYDGTPTTTNPLPIRVLGQNVFTTSGAGCSSTALNYPSGLSIAQGKVIVSDYSNHRIMIWNTFPTSDGAPADVVLGQANMTSCARNSGGGVTASSLSSPGDVWSDGTRLIVADSANNRILIWSSFPVVNNQPADFVLGQSTFSSGAANAGGSVSALGVDGGSSKWSNVTSNGTQIFFSDYNNHRALIWNSFPTTNGVAADTVLGQPNFTTKAAPSPPTASSLNYPGGITLSGGQFFIVDYYNSRVLVYNSN